MEIGLLKDMNMQDSEIKLTVEIDAGATSSESPVTRSQCRQRR